MQHGAIIQDDQTVALGNIGVILVFQVPLVEAVFEKQEEHHVDDHDEAQPRQHVTEEEEGVIAQGTQPGHDVVHVVQGQHGHQQQEEDGQIGQALELDDYRFHLGAGSPAFPDLRFRLPQKVVEAGNDDPHEKGDYNGEGEGHEDILPPGKSGLHPVVFIIRSPEHHHDKNDDFQDTDELKVIEEELFTVCFVEITGNHGHAPPASGYSKYL